MYEHLPATVTKEEVLAALDDKFTDGVILEYPLNELPDWVFEIWASRYGASIRA